MRYKFCGGLDAPDWILKEIATLARVTSVRIKLIAVQVAQHVIDGSMNYTKVTKLVVGANLGLDVSDVRGIVAVLQWLLQSAAKYDVDARTLSDELVQMGLPTENSKALARAYNERRGELKAVAEQHSLRLPRIDLNALGWRVDYVVSSSDLDDVCHPNVQMRLPVRHQASGNVDDKVFTMSTDRLRLLLHELKEARQVVETLQ